MSEEHFSAEEQAQFDAMRAADNEPEPQAQQPAAEPAAPSPEAAPEQPQQPKMVRLEALHEARERNRQLEKSLAEEREQRRLLDQRTNMLLERFNQPQQPQSVPQGPTEPAIPDLSTDPVGNILGKIDRGERNFAQFQAEQRQQQERVTQQLQQQQAIQALAQHAQALEQQFTIEHPDYADAVRHLMAVRHKELETVGFRNPAERASILQQEGLGLAARSLQFGGNPAEAIYELAKMRGYAPRAEAPSNSSPAQPAAPAERDAPPAAAERLANIQAGQQHARSLGATSGSGPAPLTAQRVIEMSEAEFAKLMDKNPDQLRALMGA